ncbi:uncharacterized protein LOC107480134 isoform X1 [Arachis duranensis]|uniref:Uncharacterized protein LOC107480134 isoform X1 n=1 Tax=Arachis duranensis TaxID=130453 RepID=A0A9C6WSD9_ARADU|nr:uncharacterized protein LOC107480134 isoform X1 [Arachis duranensis]XP_052115400.1 uncharacterized protein LOC107480134 isoform X1 [Arachis duranensis]
MISSWVLLRRRSSLVISLPAKISSNSDLLRRCLLQRRSPPATSAPATISLLRRLLQRRSPPASSLSSCVLSAKSSVSPFCSGSAGKWKSFGVTYKPEEMDWDNNGQVTIREFLFGFIK